MIKSKRYRGVERARADGSPWLAVDEFQGLRTVVGEYATEELAALALDALLAKRKGEIGAHQSGELNFPERRTTELAEAQAKEDARQAELARAEARFLDAGVIPDEAKGEVWESWITGKEEVRQLAHRLFVSRAVVKTFLKERLIAQLGDIGVELATPAAETSAPVPAAPTKAKKSWFRA